MTTTTATVSRTLTLPPNSKSENGTMIEVGQVVVALGANGSGKSRFGAWLDSDSNHKAQSYRVSAQRSLQMPNHVRPSDTERAETELWFGYYPQNTAKENFILYKPGHRWGDKPTTHQLNDFEKVMVYLFSEAGDVAAAYRDKYADKIPTEKAPEVKLDRLKRIWQEVLPHHILHLKGGRVDVHPVDGAEPYNGAEMSDGERVIFYLIGACLAAPKEALLVIDEPEIHVHRSILALLWDRIEAERRDCLFVYLTHDVEFAASRSGATRVWFRGYTNKQWDWEVLPAIANSELPEPLLLSLIGSRKPVLFVEGVGGSHDQFIYEQLYPTYTVAPVQGCDTVIHVVASFRKQSHWHRVNCVGIIDRDRRSAAEIAKLEEAGVLVSKLSLIEHVFITKPALEAVAKNLLEPNVAEKTAVIEAFVLAELSKDANRIAAIFTAHTLEARLRFTGGKPDSLGAIKEGISSCVAQLEIDQTYADAVARIDSAVKNKNYAEALGVFCRRGVVHEVAKHFGMKGPDYVELVKRLIAQPKDDKLRKALFPLIGEIGLSDLEAPEVVGQISSVR